jgi:peptidoglycan glycosyltransferase
MKVSIWKLMRFFTIGYLLIIVALTNLTVFQRERLMASPYNKHRITGWDNQNQRGGIYDCHGEALAVTSEKGGQRQYPLGEITAPIIGYLNTGIGAAGLEARYSAELSGRPPFWSTLGFNLPLAPVGEDLILTIDSRLQREAMQFLAGRRGAAVVLDPRSGAILVLASQPSFDPTELAGQWEHIRQDAAAPLLNRATRGLYPPGSTLKLVTLATALSERTDLAATTYNCPGRLALATQTVHCSEPHGELDLTRALATSCNVIFAQLGIGLGNRLLAQQAEKACFNNSIPFELPLQISLYPPGPADDGETALRALGQGQVLATPLQMALVTAGIAGKGIIWRPYLVQERHLGGRTVARVRPQKLSEFILPEVAETLTEAMIEVTTHGTGTGAALAGVEVAGKTGTAENVHGAPHAWYVGFAPADNPKIVVTVLVENAGSGAEAALPLARRLLELALEEVN